MLYDIKVWVNTDRPKLNEFIDFAVYSCKCILLFKEFISLQ